MGRPPKSNLGFWLPKIASNQVRDERVIRELAQLGYDCLVVWQCELTNTDALRDRLCAFLGER
jgi:DNA mismatch endonuclease (patch repair protein)